MGVEYVWLITGTWYLAGDDADGERKVPLYELVYKTLESAKKHVQELYLFEDEMELLKEVSLHDIDGDEIGVVYEIVNPEGDSLTLFIEKRIVRI